MFALSVTLCSMIVHCSASTRRSKKTNTPQLPTIHLVVVQIQNYYDNSINAKNSDVTVGSSIHSHNKKSDSRRFKVNIRDSGFFKK